MRVIIPPKTWKPWGQALGFVCRNERMDHMRGNIGRYYSFLTKNAE